MSCGGRIESSFQENVSHPSLDKTVHGQRVPAASPSSSNPLFASLKRTVVGLIQFPTIPLSSLSWATVGLCPDHHSENIEPTSDQRRKRFRQKLETQSQVLHRYGNHRQRGCTILPQGPKHSRFSLADVALAYMTMHINTAVNFLYFIISL